MKVECLHYTRRKNALAADARRRWGTHVVGQEDRVRLEAMAVEFPEVSGHPNRVPFEGVLTLVDVASDRAPSGARGHRVVLTRAAAEAALPSLLGMAVDFKAGWDGHDAKQKCGIVTGAAIDGNEVRVRGYLFARDWSDAMREMEAHGDAVLGMSYELADAHVEDMRADEWRLTKVTFTGAAILLKAKAAYRSTSFRVVREAAATAVAAAARGHGMRLPPHARRELAPVLRHAEEPVLRHAEEPVLRHAEEPALRRSGVRG